MFFSSEYDINNLFFIVKYCKRKNSHVFFYLKTLILSKYFFNIKIKLTRSHGLSIKNQYSQLTTE